MFLKPQRTAPKAHIDAEEEEIKSKHKMDEKDDDMGDDAASDSGSDDDLGDHKPKEGGILPWIEKYRPRSLHDISHQDEVVQTLMRTIQTGNLPHLLFYGPPGTGKTSTILAVARMLYGPELLRSRVLELNASNERGIDVIRNKVKAFAQIAVSSKESVSGYPCPPYKIIILDEADSMTRDAQSALRRTMEQYTKVTRFCIICNYVTRMIEPITSRCAKFRYKPLSHDSIISRLQYIAIQEHISISSQALQLLVTCCDGDMRRAITIMQGAQRLIGEEEILDVKHVEQVAGLVSPSTISSLLTCIKSNSFSTIESVAKDVVAQGYPIDQVMNQFLPLLLADKDLNDVHKAKISIRVANIDKKLVDGADEYLQLMDLLSYAAQTIQQV